MELVGQEALDRYLADDSIAMRYAVAGGGLLRQLKCQQWLESTPAKRMIFDRLYGDIIAEPSRRSIVDVGGGLTALTPVLAANSNYCLIDPLHHDSAEISSAAINASARFEIQRCDWWDAALSEQFDLIIANDLFPNVDQRLELFLNWALPKARAVRLSLTFYNTPRWYRTQRIGADEQLCVLAYDGVRTRDALAPHADRIASWRPELFEGGAPSVHSNGRHVVLVELRGEG